MAQAKEYAYYIEGNKISLVQKDVSFDNDADSRDYGPDSDRMEWKSPLESINDGLEILYSYAPTAELKDESSEIQIANYLSKALVYYVKAKYLEDIFKFQESELLMVKFQKLVEKYNNSIISGPRMIASGPYGIK